ncbi:MAG TPA: SDR family oxidoreductase [Nocardioides sp.]|nr:SDR family oxidoreductase [Nocardioides sp.]
MTLLMTGFPGFLGSALLPRLLGRREDASAICLVPTRHLDTARDRVAALEAEHPWAAGRVRLVQGDLTAAHLGLTARRRHLLDDVDEVWHLAAVYDLAVPEETARRVNVDGTARVLELARGLPGLRRLHHVSTCYVSGRFDGRFDEDELEAGQQFRNHYEATKYDAEVLVRKATADGMPVTIYRPGIVVGDSTTGATQKYDGPYFLASFLHRQPVVAFVPSVPRDARFCLVPRDFVVEAMDRLSALEGSVGRTYALTDPDPPTVRELIETFARILGKRIVWVPVPARATRAALEHVPGLERLLGLPAEAVEYSTSPTTYGTANTLADLAGTGLRCPRFEDYAETLLQFMQAHPEVDSKPMA